MILIPVCSIFVQISSASKYHIIRTELNKIHSKMDAGIFIFKHEKPKIRTVRTYYHRFQF